jgi:LmbE family N-acetylglucosaminyl deacetylase
MNQLARIRRAEELGALAALGIPEDHYINLGYNDGMLELENKKEVVEKLVRLIRTHKPEIVIAFDPGKGKVRWHKADHRAACVLAGDACRAAEWPLLYQGQIIHEGLDFHQVSAYLFIDGFEEDYNTFVDVTNYKEQKINASMNYVSQYTSGNYNYQGAELPEGEANAFRERLERRFLDDEGRLIEKLRYFKGIPDGIGR